MFRGTATQEQKDTVLFWLQNYTGNFGKHIIDKLVPTNFDVVLADGKEKKSSATIVFELTIDDGDQFPSCRDWPVHKCDRHVQCVPCLTWWMCRILDRQVSHRSGRSANL